MLFRGEWLDLMGGGGQTSTLCGSSGKADGDGAAGLGWKGDSVRIRGIAVVNTSTP